MHRRPTVVLTQGWFSYIGGKVSWKKVGKCCVEWTLHEAVSQSVKNFVSIECCERKRKWKNKTWLEAECPSASHKSQRLIRSFFVKPKKALASPTRQQIHAPHTTHSKHAYNLLRLGQMSSQYRKAEMLSACQCFKRLHVCWGEGVKKSDSISFLLLVCLICSSCVSQFCDMAKVSPYWLLTVGMKFKQK